TSDKSCLINPLCVFGGVLTAGAPWNAGHDHRLDTPGPRSGRPDRDRDGRSGDHPGAPTTNIRGGRCPRGDPTRTEVPDRRDGPKGFRVRSPHGPPPYRHTPATLHGRPTGPADRCRYGPPGPKPSQTPPHTRPARPLRVLRPSR